MSDLDREKELKKLNFGELIKMKDPENYNYNVYRSNGCKHNYLKDEICCQECKDSAATSTKDGIKYKLCFVSHGSTSQDLIDATNVTIDKTWKTDGVLFLMGDPGGEKKENADLYIKQNEKKTRFEGKRPAEKWYWIKKDAQERLLYPNGFNEWKKYDELFNSAVFTFKLKNAYITNLVKCGMYNTTKKKFLSLSKDKKNQEKRIKNCFHKFLINEIMILKPKVIFCFGGNTKEQLDKLIKNKLKENLSRIKDKIFKLFLQNILELTNQNSRFEYRSQKSGYDKFLSDIIKDLENNKYKEAHVDLLEEIVKYMDYDPVIVPLIHPAAIIKKEEKKQPWFAEILMGLLKSGIYSPADVNKCMDDCSKKEKLKAGLSEYIKNSLE